MTNYHAEIRPFTRSRCRSGTTGKTRAIRDSDHGLNYLTLVYTDRIMERGAVPSTGMVEDSCDNAMAEALNGLAKQGISAPAGHGTTPRASSSQPWEGCGGRTTSACTPSSTWQTVGRDCSRNNGGPRGKK